jgi:type I restriction-modification system DNA methylase subunit
MNCAKNISTNKDELNIKLKLNNITSSNNITSMEYSLISKELTSKLSKIVKKNNGIYFTPPSCVNNNIKILQPYIKKIIKVLEPSCGSCEYITALHKLFPHLIISGVEYNETIYQSISHLNNDKINIMNIDYLKYETAEKYDLIIGNPPYFVMKKEDVDKSYHTYFEGRPNIFILFIIKSIKLLNDDGILSFILPKNFLNCLYYDKTRKYIGKHFQILNIIECNDDKYIETQQDTIILIIQKKKSCNNSTFILEINNYTIFANETNSKKIKKLYKNSKSLLELGFKVSVGNVVWNQCKDLLTDDESKTRLIYSSDIENNRLIKKKYSNDDKKNFINKQGIKRPMIVINRGYGVGEYKFNYCLIDETNEYLIENHLICIECKTDLPHDTLITLYKKILLSLNDKRTIEFITIYFGNNAINTTELNNILPIYQDI